jgi:hypothetical protein
MTKKITVIAGNYDGHGDAAVRCRVHQRMEQIQGFIGSHCHWMPPSGKCLHHIAPTAAMELMAVKNKKMLTKHNF